VGVEAGRVASGIWHVNQRAVRCGRLRPNAESVHWDFGEGTTSNAPYPTHQYSADGLYRVCLRIQNDCGEDEVCREISLTTTSTKSIARSLDLDLFPNPNEGQFKLLLKGQSKAQVRVKISNTLGQIIDLQQHDFRSGQLEKDYDLRHLAAGVYHLIIEDGTQLLLRKIVITTKAQ